MGLPSPSYHPGALTVQTCLPVWEVVSAPSKIALDGISGFTLLIRLPISIVCANAVPTRCVYSPITPYNDVCTGIEF